MKATRQELLEIYHHLLQHAGHRRWWPGRSRFEIAIGAILTQNVSWKNVKTAIDILKSKRLLGHRQMLRIPEAVLARHIRSTRYYNQKAKKVKAFLQHMERRYGGSFIRMKGEPIERLRDELLSLYGIGKETADCILLYALDKPIFVIDAYTKRFFSRMGFTPSDIRYDDLQAFFMQRLPPSLPDAAPLYNDYHAQIVHHSHFICKSKPQCHLCPIAMLYPRCAKQNASTQTETTKVLRRKLTESRRYTQVKQA